MSILSLKTENEALKALIKDGVIYVNYSSTDCDGCTACDNESFKSLEEFENWVVDFYDNAEGSCSYSITDKNNLQERHASGYWGM